MAPIKPNLLKDLLSDTGPGLPSAAPPWQLARRSGGCEQCIEGDSGCIGFWIWGLWFRVEGSGFEV